MQCPCKDCLVISMCNNLDRGPLNLIKAIERCEILRDFLEVKETYLRTREIWTSLKKKDLDIKMKIINKFLPYKKLGDVLFVVIQDRMKNKRVAFF